MAKNQEQQRLLHALRTLPVEQQVILELHYWQDMGAPELAEVMGIAQPAMRARLSRARQALRACIERMVDAPLPAHASLEDLDAWARRMREQTPFDSPATDLER